MIKKFCPLVCTIWLCLIVPPVTFAKGRVEHHQITSKILSDAGQPADRELSVYLPEEYDTSDLAYPVLYLIHGAMSTNRFWFIYSVDSLFAAVPKPMIIVMPYMGGDNRIAEIEDEYLVRDILPFIDGKYRTIPRREGRAIAGVSQGGADALHIALSHSELFRFVAGISAGGARALPGRKLLEAYLQKRFPIDFWFGYGRNEEFGITGANREFIKMLEEFGFPHEYVEDDGRHIDAAALFQRFLGSFEWASEKLGGGAVFSSVEAYGKLPKMWGEIKFSK